MASLGHFSLWGDFEAAEITSALGLEPSCVYPKGSTLEGASSPSKITTWDLYCLEGQTLQEQLDYLLTTFSTQTEVLQALAAKFNAEFNLAAKSENQVLSLKQQVLRQLVSLNVTVNCFYFKDELNDAD